MKKVIAILMMVMALNTFGAVEFDTKFYKSLGIVEFEETDYNISGRMSYGIEAGDLKATVESLADTLLYSEYEFKDNEDDNILTFVKLNSITHEKTGALILYTEDSAVIIESISKEVPDEVIKDILERFISRHFL